MNVRPNQPAVVVDPFAPERRGYVVTVIRHPNPIEDFRDVVFYTGPGAKPAWVVHGAVPFPCPNCKRNHIFVDSVIDDECLRPIEKSEIDEACELAANKPLPIDKAGEDIRMLSAVLDRLERERTCR